MMDSMAVHFADEIVDRLPDAISSRLADVMADKIVNQLAIEPIDNDITDKMIYEMVGELVETMTEESIDQIADQIGCQELDQSEGRMSHVSFSPSILDGFNIENAFRDSLVLLPGGAGASYLLPSADVVFKPTRDSHETEVLCEILFQLNVDSGHNHFRVSEPLRLMSGAFVHRGWSASRYIPGVRSLDKEQGEYTLDRFKEILAASSAFHAALRAVQLCQTKIEYLRTGRSHVWARSHQAVWSTERNAQLLLVQFAPGAAKDKAHPYVQLVQRLVNLSDRLGTAPAENLKLYRDSSQIIHGDIVGGDNVLFAVPPSNNMDAAAAASIGSPATRSPPPVIIDFSPAFAPETYAEGILLADAMIWCCVGRELLDLTDGGPTSKRYDMLRRGVMFRCLSDIGLVERGNDAARPDLVQIQRVTEWLESWISE